MKMIAKLHLLCILVCLLTLCLSLLAFAETEQTEPTLLLESEPNEREQDATGMIVNVPVFGNLSTSSDKDYYSFSLTQAGEITISFSAESVKAAKEVWLLTLENSYNTQFINRSVSDESEFVSVSQELPEGTYYIIIKAANKAQYGSGQYTLTVNSVEPVHVCQLEDVVYQAPTCTENGNEAYRQCNGCNAIYDQNGDVLEYDDVIIPSLGHRWSEFSVSLTPTCENAGEELRSCATCGVEDRKSIDHLGHKICEEFVTDVAPSCSVAGSQSYHCERTGCDYRTNVTVIPATGHQIENAERIEVKNATCTEAGEKKIYCTVSGCGGFVPQTIPALQHEISQEWTLDQTASCVSAGSKSHHCTRTGCDYHADVTVIPVTGHQIENAERIEVTNATCTEAGEKKIYCTVSGCGGFVPQTIPALQHEISQEWTVDQTASCVSAGSKSHHCTRTECDYHADVTVIPVTGHQIENAERIEVTNATCTEAGEKKIYCTVSGCGGYVLEKIDELKHDVNKEWTVDKEATCIESGIKSHHCMRDGCDYRRNLMEIPSKGHDHETEFTIDLEPTCKDLGIQSRHCTRCDDRVDVSPVPKAPHSMVELVSKSATCVQSGILSKQCSVCKHQTDEVIPPTNQHIYGTWQESKAPTCSAEGERKQTCVGCSLSKVEAIPKLLHSYSQDWIVDALPSCTVAGSESRRCTVCSHVAEQREIEALGHDFSKTPTIDIFPTCEAVGSQSKHCSRCDGKGEITEIPAKEHTYGEWIITSAPTCVKKGKESRTCGVCGKSQVKDTESALGHDFGTEFLIDVEATCERDGSQSKHCSRCAAVSETTVIPALGHSFGAWGVTIAPTCVENGQMCRICQTCQAKETKDTESALGHDFSSEFTVDLPASCEGAGSKSKHCSRCDETTEVTVISATGHSFGEWEEILSANCIESGKDARVCSVCKHREERVGTPALGHSYSLTFVLDEPATCQKTGIQSKHCDRCNSRSEIGEIPMAEHSYDDGSVIVEPTAESFGTREFTCSKCGNTYRQEIEKLPPVMLESAKEIWKPAKEEPMTFRSAAALADFIEVRVNGEVVPRDCYVLREGSTIVELTPEYLRTLEGGSYTLEIVSTTGIASAEFSVSDSKSEIWVWLAVGAVLLIGGTACTILICKRRRRMLARKAIACSSQSEESDVTVASEENQVDP